MKLDILAIGVHPDDVEISCCGTLLHHIALGHRIGILDLTAGELGTRGNAETRLKEAAEASSLLGAVVRANLEMADGFFVNDQEHIMRIIEIIRLFQPDLILANSLTDRHPDHGRAAKLIADACFYSGLRKIKTAWEEEMQEAWRPKAIYHYIQDYNLTPDFVFDISPYMDQKLEIIQAYKSQFYDPNSKEPQTPISSKEFLEFIRAKNCTFGRASGFHYAEGFNINRQIGVSNLFHLH